MLDKHFTPEQIEEEAKDRWNTHQIGLPTGSGEPFCIMLPPPNVTGSLHMGHGFQISLMDCLIRYQRMQGKRVLWQVGTDHAGIATQMLVERQLAAKGQNRHDMGREAFVDAIWQWHKQSDHCITEQIKALGASVDWQRERFTLDPDLCDTVQHVFIKAHQDGLIYRGKRLVNWDPILQTAVSDLEVEKREQDGHLWHIRYPIVDSDSHLVVATTRPETLFGDAAVAVHPDDERYQHLVGQHCRLPLCHRDIPIIADDMVDPAFGSGCVKITPAHDFDDSATGKRHKLPIRNIMTPTAHLATNEWVPADFQGLDRFDARTRCIEQLTQAQLLEKTQAHTLQLPVGDRSGAILEPLLTDQWFMNMKPLAEAALKAWRDGELDFIPPHWEKTYEQWLNNIEDWCLSRQLWWGHRIPAWYDQNNQVYVGENEAAIRQTHHLGDDITLSQDADVLDTWFSSALWPFSTLGWPKQTDAFNTFYPTNVLMTGFDIIFFWVARMVMMGLYCTGHVPFQAVYITGLIRDQQGQKMSKSKGNVLDPLDLIHGITGHDLIEKRSAHLMQPKMREKIKQETQTQFPDGLPAAGTDALRFTFCALATTGRDIRFDLARLQGYRNFCNKLWNASRFVLMQIGDQPIADTPDESPASFHIREQWQRCLTQVHAHFKAYRFDLLAQCLFDFTWHDFCDWYLECSKCDLAAQPEQAGHIRYTLLDILEQLLRALHPIMPFITESLWQSVAPLLNRAGDSIALAPYPQINPDTQATEHHMPAIQALITAIRTARSEMNIPPKARAELQMASSPIWLHAGQPYLERLAGIGSIQTLDTQTPTAQCMTIKTDDVTAYIPFADLIDCAAEIARLHKQIEKLKGAIAKRQKKLDNTAYCQKAPATVVEKEKDAQTQDQSTLQALEDNLSKLQAAS